MLKAPIPENEQERLAALHELAILDTEPEPQFDEITSRIAEKLKMPICMISLIDKDREWFKSCAGPNACNGMNIKEGPRESSFCGHAMFAKNVFVVGDTLKDERFADNPQVVNAPYIRFYAGVALYNRDKNLPIGVLCVKDYEPRELSVEELDILLGAAREVEEKLNNKITN